MSWLVPPPSTELAITSSGMARDAFANGWDSCRDTLITVLSQVTVHVSPEHVAFVGPAGVIYASGPARLTLESFIASLGIEIEEHESLPEPLPPDYFGAEVAPTPADGTVSSP